MCFFAVNADIYFDDSLLRLGDPQTLNLHNQVLALMKWTKQPQQPQNPQSQKEKFQQEQEQESHVELQLQLRTNSQDAWIFQPPLNASVVEQSDFFMGVARCDNRLADILTLSGHPVVNPAFAIHAIEIHSGVRQGSLYNPKGAPIGDVRDVLLSDRYLF